MSVKVRENRVRRMAKRQGLSLVKSRRRDPNALDYGLYLVLDPASNSIVAGSSEIGFGLDLDGVESWLTLPRNDRVWLT
jgi:hypothetical protein